MGKSLTGRVQLEVATGSVSQRLTGPGCSIDDGKISFLNSNDSYIEKIGEMDFTNSLRIFKNLTRMCASTCR